LDIKTKKEMNMKIMRQFVTLLIAVLAVICFAPTAWGFCGFYVAKADTKLYNKASEVIIAREGDRTILTMANDYQGNVKDFAIVVPVPVVLQQEQVRVGDPKIIQRLDAFSAPRLVEYFDPDPCSDGDFSRGAGTRGAPPMSAPALERRREDNAFGVTVEARFTVGEYDILILSARESNGLETWLQRNGYRIPQAGSQLLQPYIRQNMKFFVAKVNLSEFEKSGYKFLRPLQMAYESAKFMLPIRLGMVNATTDQDLIVYLLSPKGQTEITNYRTVKIPSDTQIPVFVKNEFGDFYKAMFQTAYTREGKNIAFIEYAWDMAGCDPCSAQPLNPEELRQAGVFWLTPGSGTNVFITRLHVRYTRDKFPEDLMFQETANRQFFQGRYILRHPFRGEIQCQEGQRYQQVLSERFEREAQTLAQLTGWNIQEIRKKMPATAYQTPKVPFWQNIWR
jgi:hypothetical protein